MFVTPEHQQLKEAYQKLVLKSSQYDHLLKQKEDANASLRAEVHSLKGLIEEWMGRQQDQEKVIGRLQQEIEDKNRLLEKYALIAHQYEQLKRMVYGRSSEKSVYVSPDQLQLELNAETEEACKINDGQRIGTYIKQQGKKKENHPGRNEIPTHLIRRFIPINEPAPGGFFCFKRDYGTAETRLRRPHRERRG